MPLELYKRGEVWWYDGTIAGRRLRKSCKTKDRKIAERVKAEVEAREWKYSFDGPKEVLTFPQAVSLYNKAGKGLDRLSKVYIDKLLHYWKNRLVKDMTVGAIKQSAMDIYPDCGPATWNRQVLSVTRARGGGQNACL